MSYFMLKHIHTYKHIQPHDTGPFLINQTNNNRNNKIQWKINNALTFKNK